MKTLIVLVSFFSFTTAWAGPARILCAENPAGLMRTLSVEFLKNSTGTYDVSFKMEDVDSASANHAAPVTAQIANNLSCKFANSLIFSCQRAPTAGEKNNSYASAKYVVEKGLDWEGQLQTYDLLVVEVFSPVTETLEPNFPQISAITKALTHRFDLDLGECHADD